MNDIILLDNLTIQKIAAGEIIDRPASIVKELIENSIDAKADSIVIEIENGGKSLIRVSDNGEGIDEKNLKLAFKRHSTSKLKDIDDIYKLMSLGFRGEALASISTVSKLEAISRSENSLSGTRALVEEGQIKSMETIGAPLGTTMIVRDLFYNLPVRQKFLKSDLIEGNHIIDLVNKLSIGNPHISFKLIRDKKTFIQASSTEDMRNRVHTLLGKEYSKNLFPISYKDDYMEIKGLLSNNTFYRSNRNFQYIFVNKRYILNSEITSIIEDIYRSLIPIGRHPIFILDIDLPPMEIDINIHPTKEEIEFIDKERVFSSLKYLLADNKDSILQIPRFDLRSKTEKGEEKRKSLTPLYEIYDRGGEREDSLYNKILFQESDENDGKENKPKRDIGPYVLEEKKLSQVEVEEEVKELSLFDEEDINILPLGIAFSTYIIAEIQGQDKLIFIDQHAAHERIIYEKYKKDYENEEINSQVLLAAEILELTNIEFNQVIENISLFESLGFHIEEFGPRSIALRSVPLLFGEPSIRNLFFDIVDLLTSNIKSSYDSKIDKIIKLACSKAIKSGDRMDKLEIKALFSDLMACQSPYTCPHGRPTLIEISKKDIEKQFLRII